MNPPGRNSPKAFRKRRAARRLLVANRGEIALRIIRAGRQEGLETIALATGADRELPFAEAADEVILLSTGGGGEPYLDGELIVQQAKKARADLIHPGYGFLSESAEFARACQRAGLVLVGPPSEAIGRTGDKAEARRVVEGAGVTVIPGREIPADISGGSLSAAALAVGFPLFIKAAAGGGGLGIRRVESEAVLGKEILVASREASKAFNDPRVYLEREVPDARHVEVQILADSMNHIVVFPERDCSIQRRHQKIIEESPSPAVDPGLRRRLCEAARQAARAVGYQNAGTVEFLLDSAGRFYFLEVNARLQVEHPLTEMVAGLDLVAWQIRLALGRELPEEFLLEPPEARGHAIECRITAERPPDFKPSSGPILRWRAPAGPGIRFDAGYREGNTVGTRYDPLLAKLLAWGPDRPAALARMEAALDETVILGVDTTIDFLRDAIRHPTFQAGEVDVNFLGDAMAGWSHPAPPEEAILIAGEARRRGEWERDSGGAGAAGRSYPGPWEALRRS